MTALVAIVAVVAVAVIVESGGPTSSPQVRLPIGQASCGGSLIGIYQGGSYADATDAEAMMQEADLTISRDTVTATIHIDGQIPAVESGAFLAVLNWQVTLLGSNKSVYGLGAILNAQSGPATSFQSVADRVYPQLRNGGNLSRRFTADGDLFTISVPVQAFNHLTPPITWTAGYTDVRPAVPTVLRETCPQAVTSRMPFPGAATNPMALGIPSSPSPSTSAAGAGTAAQLSLTDLPRTPPPANVGSGASIPGCTVGASACAYENGIEFDSLYQDIAAGLASKYGAALSASQIDCNQPDNPPPNRVDPGHQIACVATVAQGLIWVYVTITTQGTANSPAQYTWEAVAFVPAGTPPTTSLPPSTLPTTAAPTSGLVIAANGLGIVTFGQSTQSVLDTLTKDLGKPSSGLTQCTPGPGEGVDWGSSTGGDLEIFFVNGKFVGYLYSDDSATSSNSAPFNIRTADGIGIGSTVAELRSTYGNRLQLGGGHFSIDQTTDHPLFGQATGDGNADVVWLLARCG